jgi:hypothetical protein
MSNIVQFRRAVSPLPKILSDQDLREIDRKVRASLEEPETPRERRIRERQEAPALTETGRNHRLRQQRREAWREAETATRWARALLDFEHACESAQRWGLPESSGFKILGGHIRVDFWRDKLMNQLLTPAPDANSLAWKLRTFASGQHRFTTRKPERIQQAIDADKAWLAAHPSKRSDASKRSNAERQTRK